MAKPKKEKKSKAGETMPEEIATPNEPQAAPVDTPTPIRYCVIQGGVIVNTIQGDETTATLKLADGLTLMLEGEALAAQVPKAPLPVADVNRATLHERLENETGALRNFLALSGTPNNAQIAAAVRVNCRVNLALIRLLCGRLEGVD